MRDEIVPKMDADDQEAEVEKQASEMKALKRAIERSHLTVPEVREGEPETPKWEESPGEIAKYIARIIETPHKREYVECRIEVAIEAERRVALHYMTQMGRWWARLG